MTVCETELQHTICDRSFIHYINSHFYFNKLISAYSEVAS